MTHVSLIVQASVSAQSAFVLQQPGTAVCVQPVAGSQSSVVQTLPSSQFGACLDVQMPPWQVSDPLQKLLSPHAWPFGTGVWTQPVTGLQLSMVQGLPLSHEGTSLVQAWLAQRSFTVHALLSVQSSFRLQQPGTD